MDGTRQKLTAEPPALSGEGVHLLRTTQAVQYQLSQMADQKASMLLGITFLIFTIAVGQARVGTPQPALLILGAAAFMAAVLAVMAVLPSFKPSAAADGTDNLLFFGAFSRMTQDEFVEMLVSVADTCTSTRPSPATSTRTGGCSRARSTG